MADHMYSADEAAQILGLQVRTVRNYVREGRLPGVRIGKQYRIARGDLEAFTAGFSGGPPAPDAGIGGRRRREPAGDAHAAAEVSSVVQIDGVDLVARERLERTLAAATMSAGREGDLRVEPLYDEQRQRLKVIIVGPVAETAELLRIVDALTRERD